MLYSYPCLHCDCELGTCKRLKCCRLLQKASADRKGQRKVMWRSCSNADFFEKCPAVISFGLSDTVRSKDFSSANAGTPKDSLSEPQVAFNSFSGQHLQRQTNPWSKEKYELPRHHSSMLLLLQFLRLALKCESSPKGSTLKSWLPLISWQYHPPGLGRDAKGWHQKPSPAPRVPCFMTRRTKFTMGSSHECPTNQAGSCACSFLATAST